VADAESLLADFRELVNRGPTSEASPRVADGAIDQKIAEIERWIGARKGSADYRRYSDDPGVQRQYAMLLERRDQRNRRR
jgi:hypothetical protein